MLRQRLNDRWGVHNGSLSVDISAGVWEASVERNGGMQHERFAPLVLPHTQAMARVAAALIGLADAEDAAQEALMRAWNSWTALREEGAVRSWLLRITVNVCHNWRTGHFGTNRSRTQPLDTESDEAIAPPLVGVGPGTTEHATALDLRLAVMSLSGDL